MIAGEELAEEVRAALSGAGATIREVRMFGGIGFMFDGNMVAAVSSRGLLLRVGRDRHAAALARPGTRPMEMRGRPMQGYVRVDPRALTRASLKGWLAEAAAFVSTLPPKTADAKPKAARAKPKAADAEPKAADAEPDVADPKKRERKGTRR
jgi:TfoX/Sxy family transcriptional regulator of competence genes